MVSSAAASARVTRGTRVLSTSRTRGERRNGATRERIHPLVQHVAAVSLHLVPVHVVAPCLLDEALPEVAVGDGLAGGTHPAVLLPALVPAVAKAVHDICAVSVQMNGAAARDSRQRFDGTHQLHALVRGARFGTGERTLGPAVDDDRAPAPGAGITGARAVGVDGDVGKSGQISPSSRGSAR